MLITIKLKFWNSSLNSILIYAVSDTKEIENALEKVKDIEFRKYQSNTISIIGILEEFLETIER